MAQTNRRRVRIITAVLMTIATASIARPYPQSRDFSLPPLKLGVIISNPDACLSKTVKLEIELQNVSDKRVVIDPKGIFYQISFSSRTGAMGSTHDVGNSEEEVQYLSLQPGESFRKQITYPINTHFFSTPGLYRVQIIYGQFKDTPPAALDLYRGAVESNVALFEISECLDAEH
jgi:hypothetical protein